MNISKTIKLITLAGIIGTISLNAENIQPNKALLGEKKEMQQNVKTRKTNIRKIMKQLNLTQDQRASLKANRQAMRETMKTKQKTMKNARNIGQFLTIEGVDREAMIADATQRTVANVNLRADMMEKMMSLFTPEQKTKFITLMKAEETK